MLRSLATKAGGPSRLAALACTLLGFALLSATVAGAASVGDLEAKVSAARSEASSLTASLQAAQAELAAAQEEADAASAREEELADLLATGEERAARLAAGVRRTQRRLAAEKRRLHRARAALSERLVAIYESGTPSTASVILASDRLRRARHPHRIPRARSSAPTPTWPPAWPRCAAPSPQRSSGSPPSRQRPTPTTPASPPPAPKSPACAEKPKPRLPSCTRSPLLALPRSPRSNRRSALG